MMNACPARPFQLGRSEAPIFIAMQKVAVAEIINLNQARKARDKADAKDRAAQNRVAHGRTKAEKTAAKINADRAKRLLDGAKREDE